MKIVLTTSCSFDVQVHKVIVDDKRIATISDLCECPEDAMIGRDLIDGHDIIRYIQMGYDAAKRSETLEVEIVEND